MRVLKAEHTKLQSLELNITYCYKQRTFAFNQDLEILSIYPPVLRITGKNCSF